MLAMQGSVIYFLTLCKLSILTPKVLRRWRVIHHVPVGKVGGGSGSILAEPRITAITTQKRENLYFLYKTYRLPRPDLASSLNSGVSARHQAIVIDSIPYYINYHKRVEIDMVSICKGR